MSRCFEVEIELDPVFLRPTLYSFYEGMLVPEMEKALLFQIGRKPADLILHMQRIQHHIRSGNRNELFAAIVDLFIVLGARGEGFRKRMLAAGRSVLSDKQFVFLQDNFEFGLDASDGVPWLQGSVLHSGIQGEPVDAWA